MGKERKARTWSRSASPHPSGVADLVFHDVDEDRWRDLEMLFESPGGPKYCLCMVWRVTPPEASGRDPRSRKAALRRRVRHGMPVGILGYLKSVPVAWASIAPRPTYRRLGGPDDLPDSPEQVWSLVCFFVTRRLRGSGLKKQLLAAAVDQARRRGATVVEAYPVDPGSPSYRFMGYTADFRAAGFREVARAGIRRHVMRLRIRGPRNRTRR